MQHDLDVHLQGQDDVIIYCKSNWMRVTVRTSLWAVMCFIRTANYDFFDTCAECKMIITGKTLLCDCCLGTHCLSCVTPEMYSPDTRVLKCPLCKVSTVSEPRDRLMTFNYMISKQALREQQRLWKEEGPCSKCGAEGETLKCGCVISTRYCSRKCQVEDWGRHKKVCTLRPGNVEYTKLYDWIFEDGQVTPGVLQMHISIDLLMSPLTVAMMLNCSRAKNEDRKRRIAQRRLREQQQQEQQQEEEEEEA